MAEVRGQELEAEPHLLHVERLSEQTPDQSPKLFHVEHLQD